MENEGPRAQTLRPRRGSSSGSALGLVRLGERQTSTRSSSGSGRALRAPGEASHVTSEYHAWRARISEGLIREKDFSFIVVEGEWRDCYEVNRYVKGYPDSRRDAREVRLRAFERWPTWMWANEEVAYPAELLREYNEDLLDGRKIGSTAWTSTALGNRWTRS
jgi:hypothetical protein